jgi:hypothetical protein
VAGAHAAGQRQPAEGSTSDDRSERRRWRLLERGSTRSPATCCRCAGTMPDGRWLSGRGSSAASIMYLIPGDSPMGYAPAAGALPGSGNRPRNPASESTPSSSAPRWPIAHGEVMRRYSEPARRRWRRAATSRQVHTALCVEPRDGRPARVHAAAGTRSSTTWTCWPAIEATAAELATAGGHRGLSPPSDPRLREKLPVTPDPGVIEVNIHPATAGRRAGRQPPGLYEAAPVAAGHREVHARRPPHRHRRRQPRHPRRRDAGRQPVPAPARPAAQPDHLLAAPPGLSYLFSGLFIGPTSQAPRVDEARDDACTSSRSRSQQMPRARCRSRGWSTACCATCWWTHRQHPPRRVLHRQAVLAGQAPAGRLGLVELRAFEMPPHARMSLVQMLLLRALVARFWESPTSAAGALGHRAARPLHAAALRLGGPARTCSPTCARPASPSSWTGSRPSSSSASRATAPSSAAIIELELRRRSSPGTCSARRSTGRAPRATSIPRSSACRSRCGLVGERTWCLQRPARAAAPDRRARRVRRRGALQGLAAAVGAAPHHRRSRAAGVRPRRHLERRAHRRLHLPRRPSRRAQLRDLPGQRQRGRGAAFWPHARTGARCWPGDHDELMARRGQPREQNRWRRR